jgi:hypothetical protein
MSHDDMMKLQKKKLLIAPQKKIITCVNHKNTFWLSVLKRLEWPACVNSTTYATKNDEL